MTSSQRQDVNWQIYSNDRDHKKKMEKEREQQKVPSAKFESELADLDSAISETLRQTKSVKTDHEDEINKINSVGNELLREQNVVHSENKKELAKTANRELDALRASEAANQAAMMAHQSSEKKRIEESRRQADKEAAEKIESARAQTSGTSEIAHEHDKERIEFLRMVEKDQMSEILAIKKQLLESDKLEFERLDIHRNKMQSIGYARIASTVQMDIAEEQMRKNRNASEEISAVTDDILSLRTKMNDLSSKVNVAHQFENLNEIKKGYAMIVRASVDIRTKRLAIEMKLSSLRYLNIDGRDDERRSVMRRVLEDLQQLEELYTVTNSWIPQKDDVVDMDFLDFLKQYTDNGAAAVDSLVRLWDTLPPVDKTDLIDASFLKIFSLLVNASKLEAAENAELRALEKTDES